MARTDRSPRELGVLGGRKSRHDASSPRNAESTNGQGSSIHPTELEEDITSITLPMQSLSVHSDDLGSQSSQLLSRHTKRTYGEAVSRDDEPDPQQRDSAPAGHSSRLGDAAVGKHQPDILETNILFKGEHYETDDETDRLSSNCSRWSDRSKRRQRYISPGHETSSATHFSADDRHHGAPKKRPRNSVAFAGIHSDEDE
jgi:hypothetical protein